MSAPAAGPLPAAQLKQCCADFYGSEVARTLLGESFHPGGLALTETLARALGVHSDTRVLDVACGQGASALHLAERLGCEVLGVDLSAANIAAARAAAEARGLTRVRFAPADAEALQAPAEPYDVVLCECALCTFPDPAAAVSGFHRMLKPGGLLGIADLTRRSGPLPAALQGLLAWVACVAAAQPLEQYVRLLTEGGFQVIDTQDRSDCLQELVGQVRGRLALGEILIGLGRLDSPGLDLAEARRMLAAAQSAVGDGVLGYALLRARASPRSARA